MSPQSVSDSAAVEYGPLHHAGPYPESLGSPALGILAAPVWAAHKTASAECRRIGFDGGRAEHLVALATLARDIAGELAPRDWLVRQAKAVRA